MPAPLMTTSLFRTMVVAAVVLELLGAVVEHAFPGMVPQVLRDAEDAAYRALHTTTYLFWYLMVFGGLLVAWIVAAVGLCRFRNWARTLSLWIIALETILSPFQEAFLNSSITESLSELSFLLWGAALACAYFSPIADQFNKGEGAVESNPVSK